MSNESYAHIYISHESAHVVPKAKPPLEGSVVEFLGELKARVKKHQGRGDSTRGEAIGA